MRKSLYIYSGQYTLNYLFICHIACGILVDQGLDSGLQAVRAWSPNHWTTRGFHQHTFVKWKLLSPVRLFVTPWTNELYSPWNSPGQSTGVGSLSFLQGIFPTYGTEPRSPALWVEFLPSEPQGKPKNTGVGSLSLLQWIFWSQELNWGL